MDRTFDYQVWNQPVKGYEITRLEPIDVERANELLGLTEDEYIYNEDAVELYDVNLSLHWITESHAGKTPAESARHTRTDRLQYILEIDADGKIIGGEWYGSTRSTHPDFLWNPRRVTRSSVINLDIDDVRMLVEMSRGPEMPDPVTGMEYSAEGQGGIAIPDNSAQGVTSNASVSGASGAVTAVRATLDISHTYVGDLRITLRKDEREHVFYDRIGGSDDDVTDTFDVPGFEGADANGTWTLHVSDNAGRDVGTLDAWTLVVVTDSAVEPSDPDPDPTEPQTFVGTGGMAIPDDDPEGVSSSAEVSGIASGRVAIQVGISHTWRGDLQVVVEHEGRTWTLHDQEGGNADGLNMTFPLDATGDAFSGDPSGRWTLTVSDHASRDTGTLDTWSVVVTPTE